MKNPAAFPVTTGSDGGCLNEGMTLRDYFAAKAMQAMIEREGEMYPDQARRSYVMADAMLKVRENPNENQTPKN